MKDDFNTAKVLANLFELVPIINGMKGGQIAANALSAATVSSVKGCFQNFH